MRDAFQARPAAEPLWTALRHTVAELFAGHGEPDRAWVTKARLIKATPALRVEQLKSDTSVQQLLAEEIARRTGSDPHRDLYPRLAAAAVMSAVRAALDHWLDTDPATPLASVVDRALHNSPTVCPLPATTTTTRRPPWPTPSTDRPTWLRVALVNPLLRILVLRAGVGRRGEQNVMRVLRVRGRRSGREHDVPVRIAAWHGRRYVVSLLGEAQWVRNLRAAGTAHLLVGTHAEPVVAHEVRAEEKIAFLRWYCRHPAHRLSVRAGLKADPANLTPAEIDRLVRHHPVFRLDPAGPQA